MTRVSVAGLALLVAGCSGGGGSGANKNPLQGNWLYTASSGGEVEGLTFNGDGTYVTSILHLTSSTAANAEVETGTYSFGSDTLTETPQQWSCTGADTASTLSYTLTGGDLDVTAASGVVSLVPASEPVSQSFTLTIGCFSNGVFTAQPLANVGN
jgi:hypothetical protein